MLPLSRFIKSEPSCVKRKAEEELLPEEPSKVAKVSQSVFTQNPVAMDIDDFNFIKLEPIKSEVTVSDYFPNEDIRQLPVLVSDDEVESDFEEDDQPLRRYNRYTEIDYGFYLFLVQRKALKSSLMLSKEGDREALVEKFNKNRSINRLTNNKVNGLNGTVKHFQEEKKAKCLKKYFSEHPYQAKKEIKSATFAEISEYWCPESYALLCQALEFYALKSEKPNWMVISLFVGDKSPRACYIMAWYLKGKQDCKNGLWPRDIFHSFISLIPFRNNTRIFWNYLEKAVGKKTWQQLKTKYDLLLKSQIDLPKNLIQIPRSEVHFDKINAFHRTCAKYSNDQWENIAEEFNQIADLQLNPEEYAKIFNDLKQLKVHASNIHELFLSAISNISENDQVDWTKISEDAQLSIEECQIRYKWHCIRKEGTAVSRFYRLLKLHIGCILVFHQHALAKKGEESEQFQVDQSYVSKKLKKLFPDFVFEEKGISDLVHQAKEFSQADQQECISEFYKEFPQYEKLIAYLAPSQTSEWSEEEIDRLQNALKSVEEKPNWVKISRAVKTKNCFDCKKKALKTNPTELSQIKLGALIFFNEFSAHGRSMVNKSDSKYVVQKYNKYFDQNLTVKHLKKITENQISQMTDSEMAAAKDCFLKEYPKLQIKVDFLKTEAEPLTSEKVTGKTAEIWSDTEIKLLKLLHKKYSKRENFWAVISSRLKTKNANQCKGKWHRLINRSNRPYHAPYSDEENGCLLHLSKIKHNNKDILAEFNKQFPKRKLKYATLSKHLTAVRGLSAVDKKKCEEAFIVD